MGVLSRNIVFFCVKVTDITGLTDIQIYYENETVSTLLWISSGRLDISPADPDPLGVGPKFNFFRIWSGCISN